MSNVWLTRAYLFRLNKKSDGDVVIAVKDDRVIAAATSPKFNPSATATNSPFVILLQGMNIADTDGVILYSTVEPSEMCKGMARLYRVNCIYYKGSGNVKMKHVSSIRNPSTSSAGMFEEPSFGSDTALSEQLKTVFTTHTTLKPRHEFEVPANIEDLPMNTLITDVSVLDEFFMYLVMEMARRAFGRSGFHERNRSAAHYGKNIASLLVDEFGTVLSWGVNTNQSGKWRHAEVNTLLSFVKGTGGKIPDGATLYTTLEPCEMCAGMIKHLSNGSTIRVIQAMKDSTLKGTVLTEDPPDSIKVSASSAKFFLNASTNGRLPLNKTALLPDALSNEFSDWQGGDGRNTPMTQFFSTNTFVNRISTARQHWFELLWNHLQQKFYSKHKVFCDANVGRKYRTRKVGWSNVTESAVFPEQAVKLGTMLTDPRGKAAMVDMRYLYNNLQYVFDSFDAFLRSVPNSLGK